MHFFSSAVSGSCRRDFWVIGKTEDTSMMPSKRMFWGQFESILQDRKQEFNQFRTLLDVLLSPS